MDGKPTARKINARIAHDGKNHDLRLQENMDTSKIVWDAPTVWSGDDWEVFERGATAGANRTGRSAWTPRGNRRISRTT